MRKQFSTKHSLIALTVLTLAISILPQTMEAQQQDAEPATGRGIQSAVSSPVPSRVVERVDDAKLVRLSGNTHPMARQQFDKGLVDPQLSMERIVMVLKRSPAQQAALDSFMAQQYDPKSPNFHHWLQPEEFGQLYGPSDSDITAITSWLQNHGFQIYLINKGRVTLEFSGTAAQVEEAFHTEMHHYLVNGKTHLANDRDPQIPQALAPVITGIASLHDFFPVHQSILGRRVYRDAKTGRVTPVDAINKPKPQYGFTDEQGDPTEDITPYDFATIYNLLPLWNAGITGKGQTIAISAVTDIYATDVATFRKTLGLGSFTGTISQIHNGTDPGVDQGSLVENTLDTEWSGATAPDANVDVVISASTTSTFGGQLSDQYIVEHPSLFTIMSASYGGCEIVLGTAGNSAMNAIYQQGSAAGISMFESSGDQGSTGCDNSDATTFPAPAGYGLQVNGDASSPWITAVGGTEFTWQNFRTTYWGATNSSTNLSNALGYIPESPWNGTCTSQLLLDRFWQPNYGYTTLEQVCNETAQQYDEFVKVTGGSGGVSSCITSDGSTFASCGGGYAQPSYQKGITGMPGTQYRYLPDVSLFASSGFPYGLNGSAYLICVASNGGGTSCDYTDDTKVVYQEVGGTSVSSPALAGIMALVQQKQGKSQGLANPAFYALSKKDNLTNCNSSTVKAGNACNFYDTTYGTIAQVCTTGSRNCVTNTTGDTYGVVSGYATTTGYDQATGLGSVNATNLVNNWSSVVTATTYTLSLSPTSLAFGTETVGSTTAAQVVTVKNTGTGALTLTSETVSAPFVKSATTCGSSLAVGASCTVSVEYKPTAASASTGTLVVASNGTSSPASVALTGTGKAATTMTLSLSPTSLAFGTVKVGSTSAAQVVTVKNTGSAALTLTSETVSAPFVKSATTCTTSLAVGASCTVSVEYKPTATGASTGTVVVASNGTSSPASVALTGTGATYALSMTPASLAFGTIKVGSTSSAQVVTVKNTGTAALTLSSETVSAPFVKSATTCGTSLGSGATCTVSVEYKPTATGASTGTLVVASTGTSTPASVALTGTGATYTLSLSPTPLAFGNEPVGSTTAAKVVTVKNTGTAALTLTSETVSAPFLKSATTCTTTLAVGASCTVSVTFKPTSAVSSTGTLVVASNGTSSPASVSLTGTGTAVTTPTLTLTPTSIAFPNTIVGATSDAVTVAVKNTSTVVVTLSLIQLGGTNYPSFQDLDTCGATLGAGATCNLYVAFKPASAAALTATIAITDNASGSPQKVTLTGTGTAAPSVKLSVTSLAFPTTTHGTTSDAMPVTLTNSGTAILTLTSITLTGTNPTNFEALDTCGATLAPAASCTVYVGFKPAAASVAYSAKLTIADNGAASPQSVTLTGTGK